MGAELPLLRGAVPAKLRPQAAPAEGVVGMLGFALFSNALAIVVMRSRLAAILPLIALLGCAGEVRLPFQPAPVSYDNPVLLRVTNHELVWDGVVDVVSQYFRIDREDPVRLLGNTLTEGRIDTFPKPGATLLEPWEHDSADSYERLESTLQSIRRYAVVKVIPAQNGGFWIDVAVYKELENVLQPDHATAGSATFRNDVSPNRNDLTSDRNVNPNQPSGLNPIQPKGISPVPPVGVNPNWIPQGRDTVAEQRILGQILDRFTPEGTPIPVN